MQNGSEGAGDDRQQRFGIEEFKPGNQPVPGLSREAERTAPAASARHVPGASSEAPHKYITRKEFAQKGGQAEAVPLGKHRTAGNALALPFDSGPESFRTAAVPLPAETGGEAISYRVIVGSMLERVKHYPESALQHGVKGAAMIGFVLDDLGSVASVVLLRSSGQADLDAESVALVSRAAPFPPPPPGARHSLAIEVAFGMGNSK